MSLKTSRKPTCALTSTKEVLTFFRYYHIVALGLLRFFMLTTEIYCEVLMDLKGKKKRGFKLLRDMYRKKFRVPENMDYYSKEDLKKAEKKYVKLCLITGNCR